MTERYVKLVDGVEVDMTPEEVAARQAEENAPPAPKSLADDLKDFLYENLQAYLNIIDPVTEVKMRQLQKSLEAIPAEMEESRFAVGVRPIIEGFEIPDVPELAQLKQAMLDKIDAVITP